MGACIRGTLNHPVQPLAPPHHLRPSRLRFSTFAAVLIRDPAVPPSGEPSVRACAHAHEALTHELPLDTDPEPNSGEWPITNHDRRSKWQ
jgi:hypothetical protein